MGRRQNVRIADRRTTAASSWFLLRGQARWPTVASAGTSPAAWARPPRDGDSSGSDPEGWAIHLCRRWVMLRECLVANLGRSTRERLSPEFPQASAYDDSSRSGRSSAVGCVFLPDPEMLQSEAHVRS